MGHPGCVRVLAFTPPYYGNIKQREGKVEAKYNTSLRYKLVCETLERNMATDWKQYKVIEERRRKRRRRRRRQELGVKLNFSKSSQEHPDKIVRKTTDRKSETKLISL